jgi:hypothetical protein
MGKVKTLFQENKEKAFDKAELIIMDLIREEWDEYPDEVASRVIDIFKKDHQDLTIGFDDEDDLSYYVSEECSGYADHLRSKYADYNEELDHEE